MELTAAAQWLNFAFADFDRTVTAAVHTLHDSAGWFFDPFMKLVTMFGDKGGLAMILLALCLLCFPKTRRSENRLRNSTPLRTPCSRSTTSR